jgi:ferredoxin
LARAAAPRDDVPVPRVLFEPSRHGPAVVVDLPSGGRLVDACDDAHAPVPFSCRSASCGTCRVDVIEGMELLHPPGSAETEVLAVFAASAGTRLACQAVVRPGAGTIRVRAVDD